MTKSAELLLFYPYKYIRKIMYVQIDETIIIIDEATTLIILVVMLIVLVLRIYLAKVCFLT